MAQIFYVHCPNCGKKFPCHTELWQVDYDLLCPFCGTSFPQEASPMVISPTGEQRPGSQFRGAAQVEQPEDPTATAESM